MSALSDPIADFLTRLRNAARSRQEEFTVPYSKIKAEIARILKQEGYLADVSIEQINGHQALRIKPKFVNKTPVLAGIRRVSKPGLRRYVGSRQIPRVLGGLGIAVLSTPRGILTGHQARKLKVGGELLALVW